jgi:hypothetical protein
MKYHGHFVVGLIEIRADYKLQLEAGASSGRAGRCFWAFPESWAF